MRLKYCFLSACAVTAMVSCSNEDVLQEQAVPQQVLTSHAITFSPLSKGANTRSEVFQSTADLQSFKVKATWSNSVAEGDSMWIGGKKIILGSAEAVAAGYASSVVAGQIYSVFGSDGIQEVTLTSNGWNFRDGETRYWPYKAALTGDKVTGYSCQQLRFQAVAPATLNSQYTLKPGDAEFVYAPAAPTPVSDMQDICIAEKATTSKDGAVQLQFYHAFSQIVFKAKKTANYDVDIRKITIGGIGWQAKMSLTEGQFTNGEKWYGEPTSTTPTSYPGFASTTPISLTSVADTSNVQLTEVGQELLLIPQEIAKWVPGTDPGALTANKGYIAVEFRYRLAGAGNAWITGEGSADGYETSYFPLQAHWKKGKKYSYTLLFGGATDDEKGPDDPTNPDPGKDNPGGYEEDGTVKAPSVAITFSPSVTDWVNQQVDVKF